MSSESPCWSGTTRAFAVLGHPVAHSLSPAMHNPALRAMGVDAVYLAFDVAPEALPEVLRSMSAMGVAGCNLTIPHKQIAFRELSARETDRLADSARRAGSVNTVVFREDGSLEGHSTDGYGLRTAVAEAGGPGFADASVLVLGCGGAGRAAAIQAAEEGAARVRLANRTRARADSLRGEIAEAYPRVDVDVAADWPPAPEETSELDLVLQSTAAGMEPGRPPLLTRDHFRSGMFLLDMTYTQRETPTMREATNAGATAVNGLGMLLHQGVRSLEIWTGREAPVETMRAALERHAYKEDA